MDQASETFWSSITGSSPLLNDYSSFSYLFLGIPLIVGAAILVGMHVMRRIQGDEGLARGAVVAASGVLILAFGLFAASVFTLFSSERTRTDFIAHHQPPPGEHWLQVFDFTLPADWSEERRQRYQELTGDLVAAMSEVLSEDLPSEFGPSRVLHIRDDENPWRDPVDEKNFAAVMDELHASQIMWGKIGQRDNVLTAFLGISPRIANGLDTVVPLYGFSLSDNPRLDQQFGDAYYHLLGLVSLGIALDNYQRAQQSAGEERRRLFLLAAQQFIGARELANNRRNDTVLQKTLYSSQVDDMLDDALNQSGR